MTTGSISPTFGAKALSDSTPPTRTPNLLNGIVGQALFAATWSAIDPSIDVFEWTSQMVDQFNAIGGNSTLWEGAAGVGYVLALHIEDTEELLETLDRAILPHLHTLAPANIFTGLSGVALYAALRAHTASGHALQTRLLELLRASVTTTPTGAYWITPDEGFERDGVAVLGLPIREFGMAHGVAGVAVALATFVRDGFEDAVPLLQSALNWLRREARPPPNRYGWMLMGTNQREMFADSWCTGAAGVLRARWLGSRVCGDKDGANMALSEARELASAMTAESEHQRLPSVDMCCGTTMVAQIFRRFHMETLEPVFAVAADRFFSDTIARLDTLPPTGFLKGKLGALLAAGSAQHQLDPAWDGVFGVSLPKSPQAL